MVQRPAATRRQDPGSGDGATAAAWVLTLEAVAPGRFVAMLSDHLWHSVVADAPWPPTADSALPAPVLALCGTVGAAALSLQLNRRLDDWPWERELAAAGVKGPVVPRFLTDLALDADAAAPPLLLGAAEAADVPALAAAARAQGRPLLLAQPGLDAPQCHALERAFRKHWHGTRRARDALGAALAELGLPGSACRLYGDAAPPDADAAEQGRRPVTALSIDLVASTPLMQALGPERYAQRVGEYHKLCRDVIVRLQGSPDDPQGDDGMMAYFGFPAAVEGAAARALTAAAQLSRGVADLGLAARIGVASGTVAVSEQQAYGTDIHLAARLRALAQPGQVLVAPSTALRAPALFELIALPPLSVKDFGSVTPYRLGSQARGHRAAAALADGGAPFVGREREREALRLRWRRACAGRLQWCAVRGEAGIGKSRLLREFLRELQDQGHRSLVLAGQSQAVSSPFAAVLDALRRHWAIEPQATLEAVKQRLAPLWPAPADAAEPGAERLDAVARALLQTSDDAAAGAGWSDALLEAVRAAVGTGPCCVLVDDAHWLDPSSAELLRRLRLACADRPLLLLLGERTEFARAPLAERGESIALPGLAPEEALALADAIGAALPQRLRYRIVDRADGIPLFLVESLRMLHGRRADPGSDIPATLEDLLMVRLDDLGPDRELAQLLSLLGRECSALHVQALLAQDDPFVQRAQRRGSLASLAASRVVIATDGTEPGWRFSHALLRDAAYASIGTPDRQRLHGLCADLIAQATPGLARQRPEHVAFHLEAADRLGDARAAWAAAARLAAARHAHQETVDLAQNALALHAPAPGDEAEARSVMRLHLLVASANVALHGYGSADVEAAYRAAELAGSRLADSTQALRVRLGLEACYVMRGDLGRAAELAEAAVEATDWAKDARLALQAHWARANVRFHRGDWDGARAGFEQCLAHYAPELHRPSGVQDPAVMCLGYASWIDFEQGRADAALQRLARMLALAEALQHPFSSGVAHGFAASIKRLCGDSAGAWPHAEAAVRICERGGFAVWLAHAWMARGQLRSDRGDIDGGAADMERGYRLWTDGGARISCATYLTTRAEILLRQRRTEEAAAQLGLAERIAAQIGEHYWQPERERLQGLCAWQSGERALAGERLAAALATAQAQRKPGLALRCALSLGALEAVHGDFDRAVARLHGPLDALPDHGRCRDSRWARHALQCWRGRRRFASAPATPWEPL